MVSQEEVVFLGAFECVAHVANQRRCQCVVLLHAVNSARPFGFKGRRARRASELHVDLRVGRIAQDDDGWIARKRGGWEGQCVGNAVPQWVGGFLTVQSMVLCTDLPAALRRRPILKSDGKGVLQPPPP